MAAQGSLPQTFNGPYTRCLWWGTKPQECHKTSTKCIFCDKSRMSFYGQKKLIWWNFVWVYCARIAVRARRHVNMHLSSASGVRPLWFWYQWQICSWQPLSSPDFKQMPFGDSFAWALWLWTAAAQIIFLLVIFYTTANPFTNSSCTINKSIQSSLFQIITSLSR